MRAFLRSSEECFQLKPHTTTIGRHQGSDIVLQSAGVAEHHAALEFTASDNSFCLQDLNSPHGTFINGCQVQNAAVRVSPGDVLRFGKGGAAFELVVDGAAQVRMGRWAPGATGHMSHPLLWKRPRSAWARSMATTVSLDAFSRPSAVRPGRTCSEGKGMKLLPLRHFWFPKVYYSSLLCRLQGEQVPCGWWPGAGPPGVVVAPGWQMAPLINPQGEKEEMGHLSGLETASKQKDAAIRDLQEEIAVMAKTLAQVAARNEVELTQKLLAFDQELEAKAELIRALREQISNLEKGSSQVFSHSLYERDLEIGRLRKESEKLKRDHALATGLVTSLQREVAGKEQKIQQLQQEVEKVQKENRVKDNQLAVLSAKCSRIRAEMKQELGKQEVAAYRNRIKELEHNLERLQGEIQKYCSEQESIRSQLAEKAKVTARL
ncbi:Forkhead-associated domain-containing protein 1, partial [Nestor notabilis]